MSWLAAYALGIAYARDDAEQFVHTIAALASHDPLLLTAARRQLASLHAVDPATRAHAQRLLAAAACEPRPSAAPPRHPDPPPPSEVT